jgi:predicted DNA-binding antitoxin AbrB/MazE fold protein
MQEDIKQIERVVKALNLLDGTESKIVLRVSSYSEETREYLNEFKIKEPRLFQIEQNKTAINDLTLIFKTN